MRLQSIHKRTYQSLSFNTRFTYKKKKHLMLMANENELSIYLIVGGLLKLFTGIPILILFFFFFGVCTFYIGYLLKSMSSYG